MIKIAPSYKKNRRMYWFLGTIIFLILIYVFFIKKPPTLETVTVHPSQFLQQVSVSGKVVATQNLDLSFEQAGIVRKVMVKTGDKVTAGQVLASQDVSQLSAQLFEMQAGIELQKARLAQSMADASPADLKIKEDAISAAQLDLKNSYDSAINTLQDAYDAIYNSSTLAKNIQLTYFNGNGIEDARVQDSRKSIDASLANVKKYINEINTQEEIDLVIVKLQSDLSDIFNLLKIIRQQCDQDAYYWRVSSIDKNLLDTQRASVNTTLASVLSSKQNIANNKFALKQAINALDLLNSPLRNEDIAVFQAQIRQAQASAQNILAQINKRQILAPIDGIVTQVNVKSGSTVATSQSTAGGQAAISMISLGRFQIESYVPEIYISLININNEADVTLDSFGGGKIFKARVIGIDPSETLKDGVSTYKVTLEFNEDTNIIRDGMTANVVITTAKKENVISVLQGLVISRDGKKFIKVLQDKKIIEKEVILGEFSSSGQVEIVAGLLDNDVVVIK